MTNNKSFEQNNGKIKIPYNFGDEKYIIGIEKRSDNTLVAGKTIIPIKDSKPSYILEVTPKTTPTFHLTKSGEGVYKIIANKVYFNINFIVDEIPLTTSDCQFDIDWKDKYELKTTNLPYEIEIVLKENYTTITRGTNYYEILENNGVFSDKINLNIIENETQIVYSTVLEIVFQKSYFETISKYDSIDIAQRSDNTEIKKNVISIDGYYNDNKVNKEDLKIKLNTNQSGFTSIASTMGYIDITKEKNEWYLTHKELSKTECEKNPFYNWYVDKGKNIYYKSDDGDKLIVSGKTLYDYDATKKIFDSDGYVYDGTAKLIDNSGNTFHNNNKIIDNSGNTILSSTVKINNSGNTLYNSNKIIDKTGGNKLNDLSGSVLADLTNKKIYHRNTTAVTYNYNENKIVSANTSSSLTLLNGNIVPCHQSNYNIEEKQLYTSGASPVLLYDNNSKYTYVNNNIFITSGNTFYYGNAEIIDSSGNVSAISGFNYNIANGTIKDNSEKTIVTVINKNNTGTTKNTTSSVSFNSGYTESNGFYIANLDGSLKYKKNGNPLISAQTIYNSNGSVVLKNYNSKLRFQLVDGNGIELKSINGSLTSNTITGYTSYTGSTQTFVISGSICTYCNSAYYSSVTSGSTWEIINKNSKETVAKYEDKKLTFYLKDKKELTSSNNVIQLGEGIGYNRTDGNFTYDTNVFANVYFTSLSYNYIKLNDVYRYFPTKNTIQYGDKDYSSSNPNVVLTTLTFNSDTTFTGGTQIVNGVIKYKTNVVLSGSTGTIILQNNSKYFYKYKDKSIYYSGTTANYILSGGKLYDSAKKVIFNLQNDQLINPLDETIILSETSFYCKNNYYFDVFEKKMTYNNKDYAEFGSNKITLKIEKDYDIGYDNNYSITGDNINLKITLSNNIPVIELDKTNGCSLTASTRNDRSIKNIVLTKKDGNIYSYSLTANTDNQKPISVTGITVEQTYNQRRNYEWDKASGNIIYEGYVITNNSNDRLFYYCNAKGEILINGNLVEYVTTNDGKYYDLKTGKQVIMKDGDIFIDASTNSVLPLKDEILDKYNNIKLDRASSYDLFNDVKKDSNNKVANNSNGEEFTNDEIFVTKALEYNKTNTGVTIYDNNGRKTSSNSNNSVTIEGGLTVSGTSIYSGRTEVVSGITETDTIAIINNAKDITLSEDKSIVYYRNKKAYEVGIGGYYYEKEITQSFATGFTLDNGLEISPYDPYQAQVAATGGSGQRPDYSHGVNIKVPNTTVSITFLNEGGGGGTITIPEEGEDHGFTTDGNGNLYLGSKTIISGGTLFNPRDPKLFDKNYNSLAKLLRYSDDVFVDLNGEIVDIEIENKEDVYYSTHSISAITANIPDLTSYILKSQTAFTLNIDAEYLDVMHDEKSYMLIDGGNNNSSYKINVEPQFITQNMINNGSVVTAKIVNNNGDHIPYSTYSNNNYTFDYVFDASNTTTGITEDTLKITLSTGTPIFNEIKFSLYCNGKLVNQEIIEVLGENKLITSTEYINNTDSGVNFRITETSNTYYNTTIIWGIEKGITGVKLSNNTLIIPSGVTGTVILSGTCNNIKVYEKAIVITKNGEKGAKGDPGPQGPSGETGNPGPRGKLLYPAGMWNGRKTYYGTDEEKTPFVMHNDKYWVLTATTNVTGDVPSQSSTAWTEMEQYEAIYTKLLVAENGLVGGSVYNGDYVFSKDGKNVSGNSTSSYSGFTNVVSDNPNLDCGTALIDLIFKGHSTEGLSSGEPFYDLVRDKGGNFIPNYLVDFNKGRAWFGNGNTRILENGTLLSDNFIEMFNTIYLPHREQKNGTTNSSITNAFWNDWKKSISIYEYDDEMYYCGITLNNVFYKYISQLNSLIVDHPNIGSCISGEQNIILKLSLIDESIVETNKWYKGVVYISEKCTDDTRIYLDIGENSIYGGLNDKYFEIYPGEKIEYLYKWSGNVNNRPIQVDNTLYSVGGIYEPKIGELVVFSNKTNRWKIKKLETKISELETQITNLLS